MDWFTNINIITILIIGIFIMPLLTSLLYPITSNRVQNSLLSILNSIKLIIGIILAFKFTIIIFSDKQKDILEPFFKISFIENLIQRYNNDVVAYVIVLFIIFFIIVWILEIITIPLYKYALVPLTGKLSSIFNSMNDSIRRILSAIWQIPKSACIVLIFSLLLNFYTNFVNNPSANDYINNSSAYQTINNNILHPVLSSDMAKNLPVLINDSFKKAMEDFTPANNENNSGTNYWKLSVIKYFNGVTLEEAVQSTSEIDNMAKEIVGSKKNDEDKAYLLYEWISKNIQYDKAKAEIIVKDSSHVNSGSIVTFAEKQGICFDYSCLYVSMCRAVGLKVRFVTGLAYNGTGWGDHAWNQVYISNGERWVNVDTTFGNSGYNYFDNSNFSSNHKYDVVQGEW